MIVVTILPKNISQKGRGTKRAFRCFENRRELTSTNPSFIHLKEISKSKPRVELLSSSRPDKLHMSQSYKFLNRHRDRNGPENKPFSPANSYSHVVQSSKLILVLFSDFSFSLTWFSCKPQAQLICREGVCVYILENMFLCVCASRWGSLLKY